MGCKQLKACVNNLQKNFGNNSECRPDNPLGSHKSSSVCRQCCDSAEDCAYTFIEQNDGLGPVTKEGWQENLVEADLDPLQPNGKYKKWHHLPTKEPGKHHWNDDRYTGTLTEFIRDPNDNRYNPRDPRHYTPDYNWIG